MPTGDYIGVNKGAHLVKWPDDLRTWFKIEAFKRGMRLGDLMIEALRAFQEANQSREPGA